MDELLIFPINSLNDALDYIEDLKLKGRSFNDDYFDIDQIKKDLEGFFNVDWSTQKIKQQLFLSLEDGKIHFVVKTISDELSS